METTKYSLWQTSALLVLRLLIGWHFLYEGMVKVIDPVWSAAGFLNNAQGPFAKLFKSLAANTELLDTVNFLNQWGLVLIGLSLILGLFTKIGTVAGIALLAMYYLSNPPFIGLEAAPQNEGSYLIVNKNLVEIGALWVLHLFPSGSIIGIDRLIFKLKK